MRTRPPRLPVLVLAALLCGGAAGCMPGPVASPLPPEPTPPHLVTETRDSVLEAPALPPIPRVVGPVAVRVVYPPEGALVASRDSNFIFGSVGSGGATLAINGYPVTVHPNGSFLAFLPVPAGPAATYQLVAVQGADTVRFMHSVRTLPPRPPLDTPGAWPVDTASLSPAGRYALERWEPVRVSIRAARDAAVELQTASGARLPLVRAGPIAEGEPSAADGGDDPNLFATDAPAAQLNSQAWVLVVRGRDSVRLPLPRVALADSAGRRYARIGAVASTLPDTDRVIVARPVAGGTYKWFLLPGTVVEVTGQFPGAARVRLDSGLQVFVDPMELAFLPPGSPAPRRVAGNAVVVPDSRSEWSDLRIPIAQLPPYSVDVESNALVLTLYGTIANTDIINFASADSVIRRVTWRQVNSDRAEYRVELVDAPFGYLVLPERNALVLRVRRAPRVSAGRPLQGLVIAVDAGHPPGGSTGPTGLYEAVATLGIAERLRTYLEQRGATVVMTRSAPGAVGLYDRPTVARRANAHAFVSIHLNALPDGVNPFERHGTGSYYFHAYSEPLARAVQHGMVRRMRLRDLGVYYDNLAVLRATWMPSVLCEGAFVIIPEQEAALRTPEFQDAYARGVADGVEEYFRSLARG
ncbi:MAG TPA: N-acetylmuramoyl-L-alanine amidase [Gemmatimonadaceae bacterium]|nr:N-acetylmuramoyl-L-alanine amidase [Gemmatimonadaceae bacterium]